jgi:hypothetical protein
MMAEPKFMTFEEKQKALTRVKKRLMRIQCELSYPALSFIDHALENIELAKLSLSKDKEARERVAREEAETNG